MSRLITGGASNPFLPALCHAIANADEIDFAVAFVKVTGLRLLLEDLYSALEVEAEPDEVTVGSDLASQSAVGDVRGSYMAGPTAARVRILTSDYLDVTDPEAGPLLRLLAQRGADVRVYESAGSSFHLKAYLFARRTLGELESGTAFIGSSNISQQALTDGLDDDRVEYPGDVGYLEARERFEELFDHPRSKPWTSAGSRPTARAEPLRPGRSLPAVTSSRSHRNQPESRTRPWRILATRDEGYRRGLVVLATGSARPGSPRSTHGSAALEGCCSSHTGRRS
ncbi:MAG: phospholipase D-like domain-containing protein [Gammaproteobacteria bacterium]|nr:phospholipase D-like domain-containing protein [Gammaproteobacteria bacterium]